MGCYGCKCNFCARNCELYSGYFTPGEISDVSEVCYTCDECRYFDGDYQKKSMKHRECDGYREAAKHIEASAIAKRRKFQLIKGGKF